VNQPSSEPTVVGIDGCKAGWVAVRRGGDGRLTATVTPTLADVHQAWPDAALWAVDMPLGLPEREVRACDVAARRFLGAPRSSSVFSAPVRASLPAVTYEAAAAIHRRVSGRGLTVQAFNLFPKIRELDAWLDYAVRPPVHEVHPEVSFAAWHGAPLREGKRTPAGRSVRRALIGREHEVDLAALEDACGRGCAPDDLYDAVAVCWSAWRIATGAHGHLAPAETDRCGRRMEILY
jgi:predicted RNase H-like nuclease